MAKARISRPLEYKAADSMHLVEEPPYDLEERMYEFARDCRALVRRLPKDIPNLEDAKQLVRASGSVAANYIEANESLGRKDFLMHVKISRKEARESRLFLRLIMPHSVDEKERTRLMGEAEELKRIFSSILNKSQNPNNK